MTMKNIINRFKLSFFVVLYIIFSSAFVYAGQIDDMYKDLYSIRTVPTVQKDKIISKDKEKKFIDTNTSSYHYKTVSTGFGVTKVNKFLNTTNSKFEDTKDNFSFCKFYK